MFLLKLQSFLVVVLIYCFINASLALIPQTKIIDIKQGVGLGGVWKSDTQWKAHWVKQWELRKVTQTIALQTPRIKNRNVWVAVWKKVWSPVELKEWIPVPKIPPPHPPSWIQPLH